MKYLLLLLVLGGCCNCDKETVWVESSLSRCKDDVKEMKELVKTKIEAASGKPISDCRTYEDIAGLKVMQCLEGKRVFKAEENNKIVEY